MSRVAKVEAFILTVPRDEPYLGALRRGEEVIEKGYFVRKGNKTVYLDRDRTVLVRVICRDPAEASAIHDDLYDLMRVRG